MIQLGKINVSAVKSADKNEGKDLSEKYSKGEEFGKTLSDKDVTIIDPFAGEGHDLSEKYSKGEEKMKHYRCKSCACYFIARTEPMQHCLWCNGKVEELA